MVYAILILFVVFMAFIATTGRIIFGGASGWGFADGLWSWPCQTDEMDRQELFSRTMTCLHYKEVSFHE